MVRGDGGETLTRDAYLRDYQRTQVMCKAFRLHHGDLQPINASRATYRGNFTSSTFTQLMRCQ